MLFAGKTTSGRQLWPWWWCFLFGGDYRQQGGGYAWTPGVWTLTRRYYLGKWYNFGYTWAEFVGLKGKKSIIREAYKQWYIMKMMIEDWKKTVQTRQAGCAHTGGPNSLNGNQVAPECSESHPTNERSDTQ